MEKNKEKLIENNLKALYPKMSDNALGIAADIVKVQNRNFTIGGLNKAYEYYNEESPVHDGMVMF